MIVVFFQWSTNSKVTPQTSKLEDPEKEILTGESTEKKTTSTRSESKEKMETNMHELGKNFFFLVANYQQFELLEYYIKPKSPFDKSESSPLEK